MKKNLKFQILIILLVTFGSGLLFNLISDNGIDLLYQPQEIKAGSHLSAEETYRVLREGRALFIDARYKKEFDTSHIPGSINISANLPRDAMMEVLEPIPKDELIVIYCSSASCQSARRLAGLMTYLGYERVHVFLAGYTTWLQKGYPVEKSDNSSNNNPQ